MEMKEKCSGTSKLLGMEKDNTDRDTGGSR